MGTLDFTSLPSPHSLSLPLILLSPPSPASSLLPFLLFTPSLPFISLFSPLPPFHFPSPALSPLTPHTLIPSFCSFPRLPIHLFPLTACHLFIPSPFPIPPFFPSLRLYPSLLLTRYSSSLTYPPPLSLFPSLPITPHNPLPPPHAFPSLSPTYLLPFPSPSFPFPSSHLPIIIIPQNYNSRPIQSPP